MNTLIGNNSLQGFAVISDPEKWKELLSNLPFDNEYFFFFNEERGKHINLFFKKTDPKTYKKINNYLVNFLKKSENNYQNTENDLLFINFEPNTILPIIHIETVEDLTYGSKIEEETIIEFLFRFNHVLVASMQYNNFFVVEKNRLNFAIQLVLMAFTKIDKKNAIIALEKEVKDDKIFKAIFKNSKNSLVSLFQDLQTIKDEEIENWVKSWLALSNNFVKNLPLLLIIEIICHVLNLKTKKKQLIYLIKETLKSS